MVDKELRSLSVDELNARIEDAREELMNLRFRQATGELTDFNQIRRTRREIARMLTLIREIEIEAELEGES
jgi:large subunit ribosomal protein L29